jgi:ABC-type branched-subunit amino acid transport system ATPase component
MVTTSAAPVIEAREATVAFGGVRALDNLSLVVAEGESVGVVGPNGAGKSTLLSVISGARRPTSGSVSVLGRDTREMAPYQMARLGVGLAHQVPKPFRRLTVRENLSVAAQVLPRSERRAAWAASLDATGLGRVADREAGSLGLLDLKRLELARALALRPRLILLDEVAAGLNGSDLDTLIDLLHGIRAVVPTLLFVEHVQDVVHAVAERVVVLEWGKQLMQGTPAEVSSDPRVIESYLGTSGQIHLREPERPTSAQGSTPVLEARGISASYGQVRALDDVSLSVGAGEIVGVFGANGAGKTTLSKVLLGVHQASSGSVLLNGDDVSGVSPHERVDAGIALCPEGRRLFADLSVARNLELGLRGSKDRSRLDAAFELFPKLTQLVERRAGSLSGGEQQMVAIGRALASNPSVIVMDEVSLGLAPVVVDRLYEAVLTIRSWGTSVLMVEQSIHRAMSVSDRVLLLQQGQVAYWGHPASLDENTLQRAYLGSEGTAGDPMVGSSDGKVSS